MWRSWATSGSQGRRGVLRHLSLPFCGRGLFNNFSVPDVRKEGAQGTQPRLGPRAGRARGWFRKDTGAAPGGLGRRPSGLNACGAAGGPGSTADSALVGGGRLGRGPRAWEGASAERIPVRRLLSWPLAGRGNRNPAFQESDWGSGHSLGSAGRRDLRNCCGSLGPTGAERRKQWLPRPFGLQGCAGRKEAVVLGRPPHPRPPSQGTGIQGAISLELRPFWWPCHVTSGLQTLFPRL